MTILGGVIAGGVAAYVGAALFFTGRDARRDKHQRAAEDRADMLAGRPPRHATEKAAAEAFTIKVQGRVMHQAGPDGGLSDGSFGNVLLRTDHGTLQWDVYSASRGTSAKGQVDLGDVVDALYGQPTQGRRSLLMLTYSHSGIRNSFAFQASKAEVAMLADALAPHLPVPLRHEVT